MAPRNERRSSPGRNNACVLATSADHRPVGWLRQVRIGMQNAGYMRRGNASLWPARASVGTRGAMDPGVTPELREELGERPRHGFFAFNPQVHG